MSTLYRLPTGDYTIREAKFASLKKDKFLISLQNTSSDSCKPVVSCRYSGFVVVTKMVYFLVYKY